jgi:hypothetical protein
MIAHACVISLQSLNCSNGVLFVTIDEWLGNGYRNRIARTKFGTASLVRYFAFDEAFVTTNRLRVVFEVDVSSCEVSIDHITMVGEIAEAWRPRALIPTASISNGLLPGMKTNEEKSRSY